MTPGAIIAMMEVYVSPSGQRAKLNEYLVRELYSSGLVDRSDEFCALTPKGYAHVHQLCGTAWPKQAWIGADGKLIEFESPLENSNG